MAVRRRSPEEHEATARDATGTGPDTLRPAQPLVVPRRRREYFYSHLHTRAQCGLAQAERRALDAKTDFDQVSRLVKSEVARFEQERIEDFKNSLEAFLDGMIARQKEVSCSR